MSEEGQTEKHDDSFDSVSHSSALLALLQHHDVREVLDTLDTMKRMFTTFVAALVLGLFVNAATSSQEEEPPIDFPPLLDSDDIRYYSETHDIDGLHWALSNVFRRSSRNPNADEIVYDLPNALISKGGGSR